MLTRLLLAAALLGAAGLRAQVMGGLHPNQMGFDLMAPVIQAAIDKELQ